jgi:hypothetical protein
MNKKILIFIAGVAILLVGIFLYKGNFLGVGTDIEKKTVYEVNRPDIYFSFKYNEDGEVYNLSQTNADVSVMDGFMRAGFVLTNKEEFEEAKNRKGGEGPKSISVFVFENTASSTVDGETREIKLRNWALLNDPMTGFNRKLAEPELLALDGVDALHYIADGLYQSDTYLVSYHGLVYLFIGQFDSKEDEIYKDFEKLMSSMTFL